MDPLALDIPLTGRTEQDATPRKYVAVNDLNVLLALVQTKINELVAGSGLAEPVTFTQTVTFDTAADIVADQDFAVAATRDVALTATVDVNILATETLRLRANQDILIQSGSGQDVVVVANGTLDVNASGDALLGADGAILVTALTNLSLTASSVLGLEGDGGVVIGTGGNNGNVTLGINGDKVALYGGTPVVRAAAPTTLADVIAILQGINACA